MMKQNYYLNARFFPAILTSIPALVLFYKFIAPVYSDSLKGIFSLLPIITAATISAAIVFLLVLINRFLAKEIFQRFYFSDELQMPTTNMLLKSNTELERNIKMKIEQKIKEMFGIKLLSLEEEIADENRARQLIVTVVSQIRNSLRNNAMLLQHNIEYGFFRNLIGGALPAVVFSVVLLCLSCRNGDNAMITISIVFICIYLIPVFLSKCLIKRHGKYYAKVLYEQFLSLK